MNSVHALAISSKDRIVVLDIVALLPPNTSVWAFGSRVSGKNRPFSDLDLVLKGEEPVPLLLLDDLQHRFSESELPFRVDVSDWHRVDDAFRKKIMEKYVVLR